MPKFEFYADPNHLHFVEMATWREPNKWVRIYDDLKADEAGKVEVEITESAMYRSGTKY